MTTKLRCPVCGDIGTLMKKETITKIAGKRYRYDKWYVYHNRSKGTKQRWCYLSKENLHLPEIREAVQKEQATQNNPISTQKTTQKLGTQNSPNSSLDLKTRNTMFVNACWGRGLAWLGSQSARTRGTWGAGDY